MKVVSAILNDVGGLALFVKDVFQTGFRTEKNVKPILDQIVDVTTRSFTTVAFAGVFVGAILVLQFSLILAKYDAQTFLGGLNTSAVVREVGPLIISFLLAGKVGAFTAAELGTMRVTEQIDAIECLGTNPIQYLILPRFIGIVASSLILLMMSLMISILGSMMVASVTYGIYPEQFLGSIPRFVSFGTLAAGMFKSAVYGIIVAGVACYKGYTASGGARGVGRAVTQAAILTNLYIVIANFLTGQFLDVLSALSKGNAG
ncbi:MAG: ABC transporter permease [Bdellovibrionales bacterium]|nr:ABC transporter permease [Bdellovibrionales bacterium]